MSPGSTAFTKDPMRSILPSFFVTIVFSLAAGAAEARPYDAKALARYDHSYVACEASNPAMKGRRDEAYLHLWHISVDEKAQARLAKLRADPAYVAEKQRVAKGPASASPPASSVQRECRGLWAEHQRAAETKRP